jgi:uncharacterized protein YfaS (alpha-2-macroglobulin family)/TolA-binding protein
MKRSGAILLAFLLFGGRSQAGSVDPAIQAMAERRPEEAVKALRAALAKAEGREGAAEIAYLLARAELQSKHYAEAIRIADDLRKRFTTSPFAHKVNFLKADALVATKDLAAADEIYLAEDKWLVSTQRKEEVAATYLGFADPYFQPKAVGEAPNYLQAERFYRLALGIGLSPDRTREVLYRIARAQYLRGAHAQAVSSLRAFLKDYPSGGSYVPEARFTLGRAYQKLQSFGEARKAFHDFLDAYGDHALVPEAAYRIAETYGMPEPSNDRDLEHGVRAARDYADRFRTHKWAAKAELSIGLAYHHRGRHEEAARAYEALIERYRANPTAAREELPRAKVRLGDALHAQRKYAEAIAVWRGYLRDHTADRDWDRAQRAVLDAELEIAAEHYLAKQYSSAKEAWETFLGRYPLDSRNPRLMRLLGVLEYDQGKLTEAVAAWRALVSKYPKHPEGSRGHFEMACTLADKLGDFEGAMKELEKVEGDYRNRARARLAEMREELLNVTSERVFHSAETPEVQIMQRNLPSVSVRLYKIDMETYFRRTHRLRGVEDLDLALIAPTKAWEERIAAYAKFKKSEHRLKVPVPGPGVYAVTVAGGKLEATTVIHVSDLALITKASRHDLLVFAIDVRQNRPWPGVSLLVSDGTKLLFEGTTGADGVLHRRDALFAGLSTYRVFGVKERHVAGTSTGEVGGIRSVLSPRGLLYTDRPAYKPGDTVHVRAIVRRTEKGSYHFVPGEKYLLRIVSPKGEALLRREVVLDGFGTAATTFVLDPNAPVGQYRAELSESTKKAPVSFSGGFRVETYKLEKVRLEVVFDRPVFMRGEKLTGKIRAQYQFGEPVSGKKIRFRLESEHIEHEEMLPASGEVPFSFDTRGYDWAQMLPVSAELAGEGVGARNEVRLATEEFVVNASIERPVYLVGDEALVTVEAQDALGAPKPVKLVVDVFAVPPAGTAVSVAVGTDPITASTLAEFRRTAVGEVRVARLSAETSADTGRAAIRQRLSRSGEYVFRARAVDRFGNPIVGEVRTTASGDEDSVRLRVFASEGRLRVGENATVQIHSRVKDGDLALVTFEAEGVVGYRIVRLRPGENPFTFPVVEAHAPNVRLSVALLEKAELRQASADLRVTRGLTVKVLTAKKVVRPGERFQVKLRATDQNGKPARASLSLAMVDEALFALFADQTPQLAKLFYGQSRDIVFATAATRAYRHTALAHVVSEELLAEDARRLAEHAPPKKPKGSVLSGPAAKEKPEIREGEEYGLGGLGGSSSGYGRGGGGLRGRRVGIPRVLVGKAVAGKAQDLRVRSLFAELAYWSPAVLTDEHGEATVEVKAPDSTTTWRITVRGVTAATLVGEAKASVVAKQDFFVESRFPRALTEGDKVRPLVRVHNFTGSKARAEVSTSVTLGKTPVVRAGAVDLPERGQGEVVLDALEAGRFEWGEKNIASVETVAQAGALRDVERISLPLRPWGSERRAGASGVGTASVLKVLSLGEGAFARRALRIDLGPPPNRLLVDMALSRQGLLSSSPASIAQWVLITHDILEYLRAHGRGGLDAARLEDQLAGLAQSLSLAQNADGGFGWAGKGRSDVQVSAQALHALFVAREAGAPVPDARLQRATDYVSAAFRALPESEHLGKASLLYALVHLPKRTLASAASVDLFASANRLYRFRGQLSRTVLAYLTLIFDRLGRKVEVTELAQLLAGKMGGSFDVLVRVVYGPSYWSTLAWFRDHVTTIALWVDAVQRGAPSHPVVQRGVQWLLSRRYGLCWFSPRLTQAAVQALARYYSKTRFVRDRYRVAVRVNGQPVTDIEVHANGGLRRIDVPAQLLRDGENKIELELAGRGEFTYSALLSGFTRGIDRAHENRYLEVVREYQPAPRRFEGKALPRGFTALTGKFEPWKNRLSQLSVGERAEVSIELDADRDGQRGYVIIEEPLPAGTSVDPDSVRGDVLHFDVKPDRLTLLVGTGRTKTRIRYDLFGVIPGSYRVLPTRVIDAYDPALLSTGKEAEIEVLDREVASKDPYRPTPDEDLALGSALFEKKRFAEAVVPLERVLADHGPKYTLRDTSYREAVRMLLYAALDAKQSDKVVRYFEILKEKYPEYVLPLEKSVEIARAYMSMREHERALQVLRATAEASFNVEAQVGGVLDTSGAPITSVRFMRGLLSVYPDLPVVQTATYGLAQHLGDLEKRTTTDEALKKLKVEKGALLDDAIRIFWEFRALYPENPSVDEAGFALASAYLAREEHRDVIGLAGRLRALHPESTFLDGYEYIEALAAFSLEKYDEALRLCRRVATGKYFNDAKEKVESANRDLAVFIAGQIYHALGEPAKALESYRQVELKFPEARAAIHSFERVSLSMPEVTTFEPGERAEITVRYRNVTDAALTVYKVDLMKLYLLHRNLSNVTKVKLAGIEPVLERREPLAQRPTYREEERKIRLPIRERGAYLVVLKGKDADASSLVLVSDLKVDVREDPAAGRARVQVLDRAQRKPVRKVFVRVVGARDGKIQSATTDLRGVHTAEGVFGGITVIAAKGASYAFYRGAGAGATRTQTETDADGAAETLAPPASEELQQELDKRNKSLRHKARRRYRELLDNKDKGVELQHLF